MINLSIRMEPIKVGFGRGLLKAAQKDQQVVGLSADLVESTGMGKLRDEFPERLIEVGVAEQNLVTVASGMAKIGKIPFASSYAAFCPGRCWEQIRTTICLNNQNVKIVGSHAGLGVGHDGATHQMLEDIALMRVLPNMQVFAPADSIEAEKITLAIAKTKSPSYLRLSRQDVPVFTHPDTKFKIGEGVKLKDGHQITILSSGTATWHALEAGIKLREHGIDAEVLHFPTIKPIDRDLIIQSAKKTRRFITVEDHQVSGGFGSLIAEVISESYPIPVVRIGIDDKFGQSGTPEELFRHYGITSTNIVRKALQLTKATNPST
ncbi:MAG: transketolase family protein [Candidatus Nomurabacteria bacterium]|nr:MAG: transketolase family protein [Candidatus Nomurabacteria bacterium]